MRETQIHRLAVDLYTLPSKVLLDRAVKTMAIEDYKKSSGFEMGLVRMCRVSLEYDYQLALARLRARYPDLEVGDPFKLLLEDSNVSMTDE
ncbi:hypothetical protein BHM03_00055249 [Ensete ventricosum]|nr:hypothetical protein BHM03_00055249 [Ensete ventricosum]